ncbi:hypothetical protein L7F22_009761 [Adiantum nelumboides]|nr:hypothetical protein [Adiantum nelumboides]
MRIDHLDHLVLTVADIDATVAFYTRVLGMEAVEFGGGRRALAFGPSKINLHEAGREFEPKAERPTPGSADLCLITLDPIEQVRRELAEAGVAVEEGPVGRTGARGPLLSVYLRDPDGNLVEISNEPLRDGRDRDGQQPGQHRPGRAQRGDHQRRQERHHRRQPVDQRVAGLVRGHVGAGQAAAVGAVGPHRGGERADDDQRGRIEHDGRGAVAVPAEQRRRERQERDAEQVAEVERHHPGVGAVEAGEELVVDRPVPPDHREAQREGEHPRQQLHQLRGDRSRADLGVGQRQHQQRDRDGEHPVAEERDPFQPHLDPTPHPCPFPVQRRSSCPTGRHGPRLVRRDDPARAHRPLPRHGRPGGAADRAAAAARPGPGGGADPGARGRAQPLRGQLPPRYLPRRPGAPRGPGQRVLGHRARDRSGGDGLGARRRGVCDPGVVAERAPGLRRRGRRAGPVAARPPARSRRRRRRRAVDAAADRVGHDAPRRPAAGGGPARRHGRGEQHRGRGAAGRAAPRGARRRRRARRPARHGPALRRGRRGADRHARRRGAAVRARWRCRPGSRRRGRARRRPAGAGLCSGRRGDRPRRAVRGADTAARGRVRAGVAASLPRP